MSVLGIDEIVYGVEDLPSCRRFFLDWGLTLVAESRDELIFESLNGCRTTVCQSSKAGLPAAIELGSTIREVVWGVQSSADLERYARAIRGEPGFMCGDDRVGCTDPNGLAVRLQVTRKREVLIESAKYNTWQDRRRIDKASPIYDRATPIEVGHVVFFVKDVAECERFYVERFGFAPSDRYPGRGVFLRCAPVAGHHDLFMLERPTRDAAINHVAFTVRDIHEVFGGGMHISRCGWQTELGPGRHPISSAYFWYFRNPAGGLIEYYSDEDELTAQWQPRDFEPGPTTFAEWAIVGGIDGTTRRQRNTESPKGQFLTEKVSDR